MNLNLTQAMIDALPKEEKEYIMLQLKENAEPKQMAATLGKTVDEVQDLESRAWRRLAEMMVADAMERGEI